MKKYVDLLLIGEKGKRQYVLIKYFNIFIYDHTLHCGKKHFSRCLQAFNKEEILKRHTKNCLKLIVNEGLRCLRKI